MEKSFDLFCFTHAGGSKYAYHQMLDLAPSYMRVQILEYPGRGDRISEPLIRNVKQLEEILFEEIRHNLSRPYALYGHSMGSLIGLLITRRIADAGLPLPSFVFFTGSEGPSSRIMKKRHLLPDDAFLDELKSLGGISQEVLNEPEIMEFYQPILRSDFEAIETYSYEDSPKLNVPFLIAIGKDEDVSLEEAKTWQTESNYPIDLMQMEGDHFFPLKHMNRIMSIIKERTVDSMR